MDYNKAIDYSSLSTYLSCPREFLFRYVMHLSSPRKSIHLVFGACWHYGLEVAYLQLMDDPKTSAIDLTRLSIKGFYALWKIEGEKYFPNEDLIFPKSPGHAANMYKEYWDRFAKSDVDGRIIYAVEKPFALTMSTSEQSLPDYIGRLDLVFKTDNGQIEIVDHKTTKVIYGTTVTGFEASYQTDGYLTTGRVFYDRIPTMIYNVAVCQKSKIDFQRFQINKRVHAIEHFLSDLEYYMLEIMENLRIFQEELRTKTDRTNIVHCFPRRSGYACTTYASKCGYYDLCRLRNNPLLWNTKPPQGYIKHEWDPTLHEENIKRKLTEIA